MGPVPAFRLASTMFPAGAAYPMLPPFEVVVAPEDMLTLPVNAVAEMLPLLLVILAFWTRLSPAESAMTAPLPVLVSGPAMVKSSPAPAVALAVSTILPVEVIPALPTEIGLCATIDTSGPTLTGPWMSTAPTLSTESLPVVSMASSRSGTAFFSAMSPPVLEVALKRRIWLPASVRVVPPNELVWSEAVAAIGAIWEMLPL